MSVHTANQLFHGEFLKCSCNKRAMSSTRNAASKSSLNVTMADSSTQTHSQTPNMANHPSIPKKRPGSWHDSLPSTQPAVKNATSTSTSPPKRACPSRDMSRGFLTDTHNPNRALLPLSTFSNQVNHNAAIPRLQPKNHLQKYQRNGPCRPSDQGRDRRGHANRREEEASEGEAKTKLMKNCTKCGQPIDPMTPWYASSEGKQWHGAWLLTARNDHVTDDEWAEINCIDAKIPEPFKIDMAERIVACVNACRHLPSDFLMSLENGLDSDGITRAMQFFRKDLRLP